jgi:hypothetical protein
VAVAGTLPTAFSQKYKIPGGENAGVNFVRNSSTVTVIAVFRNLLPAGFEAIEEPTFRFYLNIFDSNGDFLQSREINSSSVTVQYSNQVWERGQDNEFIFNFTNLYASMPSDAAYVSLDFIVPSSGSGFSGLFQSSIIPLVRFAAS